MGGWAFRRGRRAPDRRALGESTAPATSCREVRAEGSGAVEGGPGTDGPAPPGTNGPVVGRVMPAVGSPSTSFLGVCTYSFQPGVVAMIKDTAHRTWRIVITVGPLAAIALSLAAGMKWR